MEVCPDHCPRCGRSGVGWSIPAWCPECVGLELGFSSARGAFLYEGVARDLVTSLKYEGQRALAPLMAELAVPAFRQALAERPGALVTWMPAHRTTTRQRGYNQAEVLARALCALTGATLVDPPVRKVRRTRHQRGLDREGRRRNLRGAFDPLPAVSTERAKEVLLVDDVYTTGATASEVAEVVKGATGLAVHVFTFCRTEGEARSGLQ